MSVAGILDAMRSRRTLSERLVWQCLENHANGARFWAISILNLADELHLHHGTVIDAIKALEADGIIGTRKGFRQVTTYFMLRTYDDPPPHSETPNSTPEPISDIPISTPEPYSETPTPVASAEPTPNPPSKNPPESKETPALRLEPEADLFPVPVVSKADPESAVIDAWNEMADEHELPKILLMTPARKRSLAARVAEVGWDGMLKAIIAVGASAFCCGDNDSRWRADFDFLLQPKSLIRVLEGRYGKARKKRHEGQLGYLAAMLADGGELTL